MNGFKFTWLRWLHNSDRGKKECQWHVFNHVENKTSTKDNLKDEPGPISEKKYCRPTKIELFRMKNPVAIKNAKGNMDMR